MVVLKTVNVLCYKCHFKHKAFKALIPMSD